MDLGADYESLFSEKSEPFDVKLYNNGSKAVVKLPCISYGDYDRYETIPLDGLYTLIDGMVGVVYRQPGWLGGMLHREKNNHKRTFIVWYETNIRSELYTVTSHRAWQTPMMYTSQIQAIGNSSLVFSSSLYDEKSQSPLVLSAYGSSFVHYLPKRHKTEPVALPDDFRANYKHYCAHEKWPRIQFPPIPQCNTYDWLLKVAFSDTDHNRHVNFANYIRFCIDCGSRASSDGFYKGIQGDMASYRVKRHQILYSGEAYEGDLITVKTWEQTHSSHLYDLPTIHFSIVKKEKTIVRSLFMFHSSDNKSQL